MLMVTFPAIAPLNIMHLQSPTSAILSAVIFNALIIIALIPLALRGVVYKPIGALAILQRNLLIYGLGGVHHPFHRNQADRCGDYGPQTGVNCMKTILSEIRSAVLVTLVLAVVCCGLYPLVVFGIGQALFPRQGQWQPHR